MFIAGLAGYAPELRRSATWMEFHFAPKRS